MFNISNVEQVDSPQTHGHPGPQNVALFRNRVFANVIKDRDKMLLDRSRS